MNKLLVAIALVTGMSGCEAVDTSDPDAMLKTQIRVCTGYVGAVQVLTNMARMGQLTGEHVDRINTAINVVRPFCENPAIRNPTDAVLDAIEDLIQIQIERQQARRNSV